MKRKKKISQTLRDNLAIAIVDSKLRTNHVADFAGVSRSQLYDVLNQSKSPTIDFLDALAGPLGVQTFQLLK